MPMDAEIKARWVEALRSGEYKQERMALRKGDGMCCLGVLCDLHDPSRWDTSDCYDGEASLLPSSVMDWAGLADMGPGPAVPVQSADNEHRTETELALDLNDQGFTFAQIADLIQHFL